MFGIYRNPVDDLFLRHAHRTHRRAHAIQASAYTQTWTELLFTHAADFTALASFTSEATLMAGVAEQPTFQPGFFSNPSASRRGFKVIARGIVACTGTPTYIFTFRLGSTQGSSSLAGAKVAESAAITMQSGVTDKVWEAEFDIQLRTPGQGSSNCVLSGAGFIRSPAGFASPFVYALTPSSGDSATWTASIDGGVTNYLNVSATCSASSASNTVRLKELLVFGLN